MRLLLDQGLPRSAATKIGPAHDCVHTADLGLARASDQEIIARALSDDRLVVTLDSDFHQILALSNALAPSVIRIRDQRLDADAIAVLLLSVLESFADDLRAGCVVTVKDGRARLHRLPLAAFREA